LTKALALVMTLPDSRERTQKELALQLSLGKAWMGDIPGPEWEKAVTRARDLCQQLGETSQLSLVLGETSIFHYVRAEFQMARKLGEEALILAQQSGDPLLVTLGHWHLGFILFGTGEYLTARAHLQQVISFYVPQDHHRTFLFCVGRTSDEALAYVPAFSVSLPRTGIPGAAGKAWPGSSTTPSLADVLLWRHKRFDKMRQDTGAQGGCRVDTSIKKDAILIRRGMDVLPGDAGSVGTGREDGPDTQGLENRP
jgi:hypothetical protein